MEDLSGRVAVVTGAASGIGRGLAERFAAEGMKVVLADVEEASLTDVAAMLEKDGADVLAVPTDVSRAEDVDARASAATSRFGAVDVLCNNAGVAAGGQSWKVSLGDWKWVLGVNLWGVIHGVHSFVPAMVERGQGHVVNTASMAGLGVIPGIAPYNATKHAVVALSESLHHDLVLGGSAVRVSVLCPGWVSTRIHESDRNRPDELGEATPVTPEGEVMLEVARQLVTGGMPPAEVAGHVVDAIQAERFYVLTHSDPGWMAYVSRRADDIEAGLPPTFGAIPT